MPAGATYAPNPTAAAAGSKAVHFLTAGEGGRLKMWRVGAGKPVWQQPQAGARRAAGEMTGLQPLATGEGFMAATADCRLEFFEPRVGYK